MAAILDHPTAEQVLAFSRSRRLSIAAAIQAMYQSLNSLREKNSQDSLEIPPGLQADVEALE